MLLITTGMTDYTELEMRELYDLVRASRMSLQDENGTNDEEFDEDEEDGDEDEDDLDDEEEDADGAIE
jgi:hypothetical protein